MVLSVKSVTDALEVDSMSLVYIRKNKGKTETLGYSDEREFDYNSKQAVFEKRWPILEVELEYLDNIVCK